VLLTIVNIMTQKKYALNFNLASYNARTGRYENIDCVYENFKEASKSRWKCEKCSQKFRTFEDLMGHKVDSHSY
jgi:PHP family Zn ribbon phosphoesterase